MTGCQTAGQERNLKFTTFRLQNKIFHPVAASYPVMLIGVEQNFGVAHPYGIRSPVLNTVLEEGEVKSRHRRKQKTLNRSIIVATVRSLQDQR